MPPDAPSCAFLFGYLVIHYPAVSRQCWHTYIFHWPCVRTHLSCQSSTLSNIKLCKCPSESSISIRLLTFGSLWNHFSILFFRTTNDPQIEACYCIAEDTLFKMLLTLKNALVYSTKDNTVRWMTRGALDKRKGMSTVHPICLFYRSGLTLIRKKRDPFRFGAHHYS